LANWVEFFGLYDDVNVTKIALTDPELEMLIVGYLAKSVVADTPEVIYVENEATHRMLLTNTVNGKILEFYYKAKENLLIQKIKTDDGTKQTIDYCFYNPDAQLSSRLESQIQLAETHETIVENPALYYSPEQLKASVDSDELEVAGQEMSFLFYEESLPDETSTSCAVYSTLDIPTLLDNELLVVARSAAENGASMFLSIVGMEVTMLYNKVYVQTPESDFDLDMATTSHAVTVDKEFFHTSRWVVFIENDKVVDVVVIKSEQSNLTSDIPEPDPDAGYQ